MATKFPLGEVQAACLKYGTLINVTPMGLEGDYLLWAIAGEESSFGANCVPRFEPGYWDGSNSKSELQTRLNAQYGRAAAMSYGPWQLMFGNFVQYYCKNVSTIPPDVLQSDLDLCAMATISYINDYVIQTQKAESLVDIARIYNSGNKIVPITPGVAKYITQVQDHYNVAKVGDRFVV